MKKLLGFVLFVLAAAVSQRAMAGEPYFSYTGHKTLYFERYKSGSNKKVTQTTTMEIGEVETIGKTRKVHYGLTMRKASGRELYGGRSEQSVTILENGDVEMDFGATIMAMVKGMFPSFKTSYTGDPAIMPSIINPGDTLPDSHCVINVGAFKLKVDVTGRKVLRRETITTPAGTFDCIVAREFKEENAPMHHVSCWSDTWYAHGVGYVRHDDLDDEMRPESMEILISITPQNNP